MGRWGAGGFAALAASAFIGCGQKGAEQPVVPPPASVDSPVPSPGADGGFDPPATEHAPRPSVLATGEHGPQVVLASDSDHLYWGTAEHGTGAAIRVMPKRGGPATTLVSFERNLDVPDGRNHEAWIDALRVDDKWVFASQTEWEAVPNREDVASVYSATTLYRAPRSGGPAERVTIPEGFQSVADALFDRADPSLYFVAMKPPGIVIAAVPKIGGAWTEIRLEAGRDMLAGDVSFAMDENRWYVAHSNYAGAAHSFCVSRAPKSGGRLESVWCPDFLVMHLIQKRGLLFGVDAWPHTAAPGPWMVDPDTGRARTISATQKTVSSLDVDPDGKSVYLVEVSLGSNIPPAPGTFDLIRIGVANGRRTVLEHTEWTDPRDFAALADESAVFFARNGEVLRLDP